MPMLAGGDAMDLWFVGLIVVLALLTWGGVVLCARLLRQPMSALYWIALLLTLGLFGYLLYAMLNAEKF